LCPPLKYVPQVPSWHPKYASPSPEVLSPSAHQGPEVRFTRALPARHVPSSGFDLPLDGLLPPPPRPPCFRQAALVGFTLRSLPLPQSRPASRPISTHTPLRRLSPVGQAPRPRGSTQPLGFNLRRSPLSQGEHLTRRRTRCSLGFHPSRGFAQPPWSTPRPTSAVASASTAPEGRSRACAPAYQSTAG